ncbi:MAG: F0F1 ATP synthase subunit C [Alphaproteobacteria bacterium]|nr:F0F1 ATP synthase subunit C [Alphaproteobacteria bacterium]
MEVTAAKMLGAGLLAFGMMGSAVGIGLVFSALLQGVARNPATSKTLFGYAIIGAALAELMGLAAIGIALILVFG